MGSTLNAPSRGKASRGFRITFPGPRGARPGHTSSSGRRPPGRAPAPRPPPRRKARRTGGAGDPRRDGVFLPEPGEQLVQRQDEVGILGEGTDLIEQLEPSPPARPLQPVPIPGMVDQDPPHRFRRGGEEVPPAVEVLVADQPQVRLMDQGGGVEGVPWCLGGHLRGGKVPQFVIDERKQFRGGLAVSLLGGFNETGYIRHKSLVYKTLNGPSPNTYGEPERLPPLTAGSRRDDQSIRRQREVDTLVVLHRGKGESSYRRSAWFHFAGTAAFELDGTCSAVGLSRRTRPHSVPRPRPTAQNQGVGDLRGTTVAHVGHIDRGVSDQRASTGCRVPPGLAATRAQRCRVHTSRSCRNPQERVGEILQSLC